MKNDVQSEAYLRMPELRGFEQAVKQRETVPAMSHLPASERTGPIGFSMRFPWHHDIEVRGVAQDSRVVARLMLESGKPGYIANVASIGAGTGFGKIGERLRSPSSSMIWRRASERSKRMAELT